LESLSHRGDLLHPLTLYKDGMYFLRDLERFGDQTQVVLHCLCALVVALHLCEREEDCVLADEISPVGGEGVKVLAFDSVAFRLALPDVD